MVVIALTLSPSSSPMLKPPTNSIRSPKGASSKPFDHRTGPPWTLLVLVYGICLAECGKVLRQTNYSPTAFATQHTESPNCLVIRKTVRRDIVHSPKDRRRDPNVSHHNGHLVSRYPSDSISPHTDRLKPCPPWDCRERFMYPVSRKTKEPPLPTSASTFNVSSCLHTIYSPIVSDQGCYSPSHTLCSPVNRSMRPATLLHRQSQWHQIAAHLSLFHSLPSKSKTHSITQ